jgi:hypothetical protein
LVDLQLYFVPSYEKVLLLRQRILTMFSDDPKGVERIASSRYARVLRFEAEVGGEIRAFFYKEFLFRNFRDRLSVLFRPSRARRAWIGTHLLLEHDFYTAAPVCVGERRILGIVVRDFLVTEAIPHALEIEDYVQSAFAAGDDATLNGKRSFIANFGRTIGRMHRLGVFQGDLRERNVLVRDGDSPKIYLIDNERTRSFRKLPDRRRLKNLVQLNMTRIPEITRTDRVRFFYAYLDENPDLVPDKKEWIKIILQKTRTRLVRKGRWVS